MKESKKNRVEKKYLSVVLVFNYKKVSQVFNLFSLIKKRIHIHVPLYCLRVDSFVIWDTFLDFFQTKIRLCHAFFAYILYSCFLCGLFFIYDFLYILFFIFFFYYFFLFVLLFLFLLLHNIFGLLTVRTCKCISCRKFGTKCKVFLFL